MNSKKTNSELKEDFKYHSKYNKIKNKKERHKTRQFLNKILSDKSSINILDEIEDLDNLIE